MYRRQEIVRRTKERDSKRAEGEKEDRSVWSHAIIVNSHLSWVIVLPINPRLEPRSGQSHTLAAAQGQIENHWVQGGACLNSCYNNGIHWCCWFLSKKNSKTNTDCLLAWAGAWRHCLYTTGAGNPPIPENTASLIESHCLLIIWWSVSLNDL